MDNENVDFRWQPIETAPKNGTKIFILEEDGRVQVASWRTPAWDPDWYVSLTGSDNDEYPTINVKYWMPIPRKPKEELERLAKDEELRAASKEAIPVHLCTEIELKESLYDAIWKELEA